MKKFRGKERIIKKQRSNNKWKHSIKIISNLLQCLLKDKTRLVQNLVMMAHLLSPLVASSHPIQVIMIINTITIKRNCSAVQLVLEVQEVLEVLSALSAIFQTPLNSRANRKERTRSIIVKKRMVW